MSQDDLYSTLKVPKTATQDEIKKSFRKLAMEHHPDKHNGDKQQEDIFKKINEAYNILSDPEKRKMYDHTGQVDLQGHSHVDLNDILKQMFGSSAPGGNFEMFGDGGFSFMFMNGEPTSFEEFPFRQHPKKKPADVIEVTVDINDIYYGSTKKVEFEMLDICEKCNGCGAQDPSHVVTCITCKGKGMVSQQMGLFMLPPTACPSCMGKRHIIKKDKVCHCCKGEKAIFVKKSFELKIPKGIPNNHELRMEKKGTYQVPTNTHRDMVFIFKHNVTTPYTLEDNMNVIYNVSLTIEELLAGFQKEVTIYRDTVVLSSDKYFNPTKTFVLKERGVFNMKKQKHGDLHIKFDVAFTDSERLTKYNEFLCKILKVKTPVTPSTAQIIKIHEL